jgi:rhodanese-related sulfurtransferase
MKRLTALFACALLGASSFVSANPADTVLVTQTELLKRLEQKDPDLVVLDVRTAEEFAAGHVPGARNVSHEQLASRIDELAAARDKQVVLYCRSGRRTLLAEDVLRKAGFKRLGHLEGDYLAWEAGKRPVERAAP